MAEYHNGSVSLAKKEDSEVVAESVVVVVGNGNGSVVVADASLRVELVMLSVLSVRVLQPCNIILLAPAGWEFV